MSSEKFKVLKISAAEYVNSRHFPRNVPNKPEFPQTSPEHFVSSIKPRAFFNESRGETVKRAVSPTKTAKTFEIRAELEPFSSKIEQISTVSLNFKEMEEKLVLVSSENQRLHGVLALKQQKFEEIEARLLQITSENQRKLERIHELEEKLAKFAEFEQKLALISAENLRLSSLLEGKRAEVAEMQWKIRENDSSHVIFRGFFEKSRILGGFLAKS